MSLEITVTVRVRNKDTKQVASGSKVYSEFLYRNTKAEGYIGNELNEDIERILSQHED